MQQTFEFNFNFLCELPNLKSLYWNLILVLVLVLNFLELYLELIFLVLLLISALKLAKRFWH